MRFTTRRCSSSAGLSTARPVRALGVVIGARPRLNCPHLRGANGLVAERLAPSPCFQASSIVEVAQSLDETRAHEDGSGQGPLRLQFVSADRLAPGQRLVLAVSCSLGPPVISAFEPSRLNSGWVAHVQLAASQADRGSLTYKLGVAAQDGSIEWEACAPHQINLVASRAGQHAAFTCPPLAPLAARAAAKKAVEVQQSQLEPSSSLPASPPPPPHSPTPGPSSPPSPTALAALQQEASSKGEGDPGQVVGLQQCSVTLEVVVEQAGSAAAGGPQQRLVLCGALPQLGNWSPAAGAVLQCEGGGQWLARVELPLLAALVGVEAKLVLVKDWPALQRQAEADRAQGKGGQMLKKAAKQLCLWEQGANRQFKLPTMFSAEGRYATHLSWDHTLATPITPLNTAHTDSSQGAASTGSPAPDPPGHISSSSSSGPGSKHVQLSHSEDGPSQPTTPLLTSPAAAAAAAAAAEPRRGAVAGSGGAGSPGGQEHVSSAGRGEAKQGSGDAAVGSMAALRFLVPHCVTQAGQMVCLVGEDPALGNWDPRLGLALEPRGGHSWVATACLPGGRPLEARLVVVEGRAPTHPTRGPAAPSPSLPLPSAGRVASSPTKQPASQGSGNGSGGGRALTPITRFTTTASSITLNTLSLKTSARGVGVGSSSSSSRGTPQPQPGPLASSGGGEGESGGVAVPPPVVVVEWEEGGTRQLQVEGGCADVCVVMEWGRPAATAINTASVRCQFTVPGKALPAGHWLAVGGNTTALGQWDTHKALRLQYNPDGTWTGQVDLPRSALAAGLQLRLLSGGPGVEPGSSMGPATWEETGDEPRLVKIPDPNAVAVKVELAWGWPAATLISSIASPPLPPLPITTTPPAHAASMVPATTRASPPPSAAAAVAKDQLEVSAVKGEQLSAPSPEQDMEGGEAGNNVVVFAAGSSADAGLAQDSRGGDQAPLTPAPPPASTGQGSSGSYPLSSSSSSSRHMPASSTTGLLTQAVAAAPAAGVGPAAAGPGGAAGTLGGRSARAEAAVRALVREAQRKAAAATAAMGGMGQAATLTPTHHAPPAPGADPTPSPSVTSAQAVVFPEAGPALPPPPHPAPAADPTPLPTTPPTQAKGAAQATAPAAVTAEVAAPPPSLPLQASAPSAPQPGSGLPGLGPPDAALLPPLLCLEETAALPSAEALGAAGPMVPLSHPTPGQAAAVSKPAPEATSPPAAAIPAAPAPPPTVPASVTAAAAPAAAPLASAPVPASPAQQQPTTALSGLLDISLTSAPWLARPPLPPLPPPKVLAKLGGTQEGDPAFPPLSPGAATTSQPYLTPSPTPAPASASSPVTQSSEVQPPLPPSTPATASPPSPSPSLSLSPSSTLPTPVPSLVQAEEQVAPPPAAPTPAPLATPHAPQSEAVAPPAAPPAPKALQGSMEELGQAAEVVMAVAEIAHQAVAAAPEQGHKAEVLSSSVQALLEQQKQLQRLLRTRNKRAHPSAGSSSNSGGSSSAA